MYLLFCGSRQINPAELANLGNEHWRVHLASAFLANSKNYHNNEIIIW
jgi:hypothetical protein